MVTVKLYPSCAATHPTIDTLLDLRAEHGFAADEVEQIEIGVDAVTPTVLIHDRPTEGLEAKFSMHFCAEPPAHCGGARPEISYLRRARGLAGGRE